MTIYWSLGKAVIAGRLLPINSFIHVVDDYRVSGASELTPCRGVVYRIDAGHPSFPAGDCATSIRRVAVSEGAHRGGETPEQAAVREVQEEAGVSAAIVAALEDVRLPLSASTRRSVLLMEANEGGFSGGVAVIPCGWASMRRSTISRSPVTQSLRRRSTAMKSRGLA